MCKVSIIVPVYNGEKVLNRCVDSILAQDYKDIEIILVDDGSKDNSFQIISEYAKNDSRVVPIHKKNSGVSSTRNIALSLAKGKYIQFVDVDDFLPFDSTKLLVRAMEEDDSDMVIADFYRVINEKASKKGSIKKGGVITRNEYADKMLLTPADFYYGVLWNKLYKKEIIDTYHVQMDENISFSEDAIFNLQYLVHVNTISVLKNPVYYYVKTEGSLVAQNLNIENAVKMKTTVIKYYNDFYKQIMDEEEYEARKPIIYGFLVSVSTDAMSLPFVDDVKKLDTEEKLYENGNIAHELQFDRLSDIVFDRILDAVAQANLLELNDVRILYYMYKKKDKCTMEEVSDACGINGASVALSMAKLTAMSYLKIADFRIFEGDKVFYQYIPSAMDEQLDKAEEDYRSICYDGLSIEDVAAYARIRKQIFANMKKTILSK